MPPIKRPAASSASSPRKKRSVVADVAKVISKAAHLSEHSRNALATALPMCLGVCKEERHKFQMQAIDMAEETLQTIERGLAEALADAEAQVAGAGKKKEELVAVSDEADAKANAKLEELSKKQEESAAAATDLNEKNKALGAVKKDLKALENELAKSEKSKAKYDEAVAGPYTSLLQGDWADVKEVAAYLKKLKPVTKELQLDDSLMTSVASAAEKKPDDRGEFDQVAITNLGEAFKGKAAEIAASIEAGAPARAKAKADVEAAEAIAAEAEKTQQAHTEAQDAVEAQHKELVAACNEAQAAVKAFDEEVSELESSMDGKKEELQAFRDGPLATFAELKARSNAPPTPVPAAEETVAAAPVV